MKTGMVLLLLCLTFPAVSAWSQETETPPLAGSIAGDRMRELPALLIHTASLPARWNKDEWAMAGMAVAGLSVVMLADGVVYSRILSAKSPETTRFVSFTDALGNGLVALPALGLMYLHGQQHRNETTINAAIAGAEAFFFSAGTSFLFKHLSHRSRPDDRTDPYIWSGPFHDFKHDAFPSGHAARAFAVATVLAGYYPDKPIVGMLLFGAAGLTAAGRLISGEHWPSDVLAGALTGFVIGRSVLHFNRNSRQNITLTSHSYGLGIVWNLK